MRRDSGFTLIELLLVMIVISIGFVGLSRLFSNAVKGLGSAEAQQKAAQYAQECAELVLKTEKDQGFSSTSLTTTLCAAVATFWDSGYSVTLSSSISTTYIGTTTGVCPSLETCKDVTVSVTSTFGPSSAISLTFAR
jgi:prepilin-type N-terminal cleavage/methylation domain-containing protein